MPTNKSLFLVFLILLQACTASMEEAEKEQQATGRLPEAIGLDGTLYYAPEEAPDVSRSKDSLLSVARADWEADTSQVAHLIWYGRRMAYLGRYQEAIEIFSEGIERFPQSPELYRHRGHRYITVRQFGKAIRDFEQAAVLAEGLPVTIEPDGIPNKLNIPLSNLQFNIYYHWALAHYLKGEFEKAALQFETCQLYANNPDLIVAVIDWLYMTYRRLGRQQDADNLLNLVDEDMVIIENDAYFKRLLFYKGKLQASDLLNLDPDMGVSDKLLSMVTQGYGVGNYYLYEGDTTRARAIFEDMMETGYWAAFGFIAAEAELNREP